MRDMNSPGMTLVLADRDGVHRVVALRVRRPRSASAGRAGELFEIGSIWKSFVALALLQLQDEGKLDSPAGRRVPAVAAHRVAFAPITTHHLLTHPTGYPALATSSCRIRPTSSRRICPRRALPLQQHDVRAARPLAWTLDGRELPRLSAKRILRPLGMTQSEPVITLDMRERIGEELLAVPRATGRIPPARVVRGAGCRCSTARRLRRRDGARHGRVPADDRQSRRGPKANLISRRSFELFSKPHILAADFGPTASYGYGIAVDKLDGNTLLRHTGGMVSFMSSMMVDIDEGVGAFASVNAQQEYRPNPVVAYAIQLMRAHRQHKALPPTPQPDLPTRVENASDYAGALRQRWSQTRVRERR